MNCPLEIPAYSWAVNSGNGSAGNQVQVRGHHQRFSTVAYSARAPEIFTARAHFSISSFMKAANCSGLPTAGS